MSPTNRWITGLVAITIIGLLAGYYWFAIRTAKSPLQENTVPTQMPESKPIIVFPSSGVSDTAAGMYYRVYGLDSEAMFEEVNFYVRIPEHLPLKERVAFLADQISRNKYGSLPIEVLAITEQNGKRIARINLGENENSKPGGASWKGQYFQGSTGGGSTTLTLKKSFLQPDYTGEWIDGVEFYYEGKPILPGEWDHIDLHGVFFRGEE